VRRRKGLGGPCGRKKKSRLLGGKGGGVFELIARKNQSLWGEDALKPGEELSKLDFDVRCGAKSGKFVEMINRGSRGQRPQRRA